MGIVGDGVSEVVNLSLEQIRLASESGRTMRYPDTALPDMVPQGNAQMAPSRGNISSLAKESNMLFANMKIDTRLAAGFGIMMVFIAALGGSAVWNVGRSRQVLCSR